MRPMRTALTVERIGIYGLLVALSVLLGAAAIYSLQWRVGYDTAWMLYIARLIDQHGMVPYRDLFLKDFPATLYVYVLIGRAIGYTNEYLFRLIDLCYLSATLAVTWYWLSPLGKRVSWGAVVLFGLAYLGSDITSIGQRDFLLILPLACAAAVGMRTTRWNLTLRSLLVGLLCGLAASIKPHAIIGLPIFLAGIYLDLSETKPRRAIWNILRVGAPALAGGLIPFAGMAIFLIASDALAPFLETITGYIPLYMRVTRSLQIVEGQDRLIYVISSMLALNGMGWFLIPAGCGAMASLWKGAGDGRQRRQVLQMIGLAAIYPVYPAISGQFFDYHWLPFTYFLMALTALALRGLPESFPIASRPLPVAALAVALFLPPLHVSELWARMEENFVYGTPIPTADGGVADQIAAYLTPRLRVGDTVQVFGSGGAPAHGTLLADAVPATAFLADEPLHHDLSQPIIAHYRRRFFTELEESDARFVIDLAARSYVLGPDSSKELPEVSRILGRDYRVVFVGNSFSIYEFQPPTRIGIVAYPLSRNNIPVVFHPNAAEDILAVGRRQAGNEQILGTRLADFVDGYDIIQAEFIGETDPNRAIERWLSLHTFRIGETWVSTVRLVDYLVAPETCSDVQPSGAMFGAAVELSRAQTTLVKTAGQQWVCVRLEWTARSPVSASYRISARVAGADGQTVVDYDSQPVGYLAPTFSWEPDIIIIDQFTLLLPGDLQTGRYRVELVVYDEMTGERLQISNVDGQDTLLLGMIEIGS